MEGTNMTIAVFVLFMALLVGCLITGIDIGWALLIGLGLFSRWASSGAMRPKR